MSPYIYVRVGKTGFLGPWSRIFVYCSKLSFCQNDSAPRPQRSCFANPNLCMHLSFLLSLTESSINLKCTKIFYRRMFFKVLWHVVHLHIFKSSIKSAIVSHFLKLLLVTNLKRRPVETHNVRSCFNSLRELSNLNSQ